MPPQTPSFADVVTGAANQYGVDPTTLLREGQIESGLNPNAHNAASGAAGAFQFVPSTARQYGLDNPYDPVASADAAARLLRDNQSYLTKALGRDPTGGELYLAHQQGAGGAAKLLSNPDAPAASIVGPLAVQQNGGTTGMTAKQFSDMWANKFAGTPTTGGKGQLAALYGGGAPMPSLAPGAAVAATLPMLEDGTSQPPQPAPTVSNGGVANAARSRALIMNGSGLGALFG